MKSRFPTQIVVLLLVSIVSVPVLHRVNADTTSRTCTAKPLNEFAPPSESGVLYLSGRAELVNEIGARPAIEVLEVSLSEPKISPNGRFIAAANWRDDGTITTVVLDQNLNLIYEGAASYSQYYRFAHWLGNDKLLTFVLRDRPRDIFGYFRIEPFTREYVYDEPPRNSGFYYVGGDAFLDRSIYYFTFNGRFFYTLGGGLFYDFETDQQIEPKNLPQGAYAGSSTSQRQLYVSFTTMFHSAQLPIEDVEARTHPVFVYDFENDTMTEVSSR